MSPSNAHKLSNQAVRIIEVGPRDGLQHEPELVPTDIKASFIDALSRTGLTEIEAGSFVSPHAIPQLADSDEVFRLIERRPGVVYSALVPNDRGLERAIAAGLKKIAVFTAASDSFNRRNIHCTIQESLERFKPVLTSAKRHGIVVRGYISTVTHCPFEGSIAPTRVLDVLHRLFELGVDEISLGETLGRAVPRDVRKLLDTILPGTTVESLSLHFHDTFGTAVANVLTAWTEYGICAFDTSAGGLGGCPFAPGASGNAATEDIVYALKASGAHVPVDERQVIAAARRLAPLLKHPLRSRLAHVSQPQAAYEGVA
jgi:hydroxymethylglutaryl-CoA lyase